MLNPVEAIGTSLKKYIDFSGRASRSEFWWFQAFFLMCFHGGRAAGQILEGHVPFVTANTFGLIVNLTLILPLLSSQVRRLHDIGWSGWWVFGFYALAVSCFILQASTDVPDVSLPFAIFCLVYTMAVIIFMLIVILQYLRGSHPNGKKYGPSDEDESKLKAFRSKTFTPQPYIPSH